MPRNKSLLNRLGRQVNAASHKSLEIQAFFITKQRTHSEKNNVNISLQLLLHIIKVKYHEDQ